MVRRQNHSRGERLHRVNQLIRSGPEAIIRGYDSICDAFWERREALAALANMHQRSLPRGQELQLFVAIHWCRIIDADVTYCLKPGLNSIRDSRSGAYDLLREVAIPVGRDELQWKLRTRAPAFATYVAARWFDGAAKLYYRVNDNTQARFWFDWARSLALHKDLWYLQPDVESNWLRNLDEERLASTYGERRSTSGDRVLALEAALARHEQVAIENQLNLDIAEPGALRDASSQHREFARGVCSILHNLSILCQKDNFAKAVAYSQRSQRIAVALEDSYRCAQAVFQQGIQLLADRPGQAKALANVAQAKSYMEAVQNHSPWPPDRESTFELHWPRGCVFARQRLESDFCDISDPEAILDSAQRLLKLVDEIQEIQKKSGDDQGLDIGTHWQTILSVDKLLQHLRDGDAFCAPPGPSGRRRKLPSNLLRRAVRLQKKLDREELEMIDYAVQVVRVSVYKTTQARSHGPIVRRELARQLARSASLSERNKDKLIDFLERIVCRELLDLLSARATEPPMNSKNEKSLVADLDDELLALAGNSEGVRRTGLRKSQDDEIREYVEQLRLAKMKFEEWALRNPIPSRRQSGSLAAKVREHTEKISPGTAIVRFIFHQGRGDKTPQLSAAVDFSGRRKFVPLPDYQVVVQACKELFTDFDPRQSETWNKAFERLGELMWNQLLAPAIATCGGLENICQLVLVPIEDLFGLPLHVALVPAILSGRDYSMPLAAVVRTAYSASLTGYVEMGRFRRRYARPSKQAVLCALQIPFRSEDNQLTQFNDVRRVKWPAKKFFLASRPVQLKTRKANYLGPGNLEDLAKLIKRRPAVLVISGHGEFVDDPDIRAEKTERFIEPYIEFPESRQILTPFGIAHLNDYRLDGNLLTVLAACVTGYGAGLPGGEVAGFVRSFIGAGAGALGVTLWYVRSGYVETTLATLFDAIQQASSKSLTVDLLESMRAVYEKLARNGYTGGDRMARCPVALFL